MVLAKEVTINTESQDTGRASKYFEENTMYDYLPFVLPYRGI